MTEKPSMTFEILERTIREWQRKTFPKATPASIATHLLSEAVELARSLGVDVDTIRSEVERSISKPVRDKPEKECGDVVTLAIGVAGELGSDVVRVTLPVLTANLGRTWGDVNPTTGIVEHVEDQPSRRRTSIDVALVGMTPKGYAIAGLIAGSIIGARSVTVDPMEMGAKKAVAYAHAHARAICVIGKKETASGFADVTLTDSGEIQQVPLTAAGIVSALPWLKVSA